MIIKKCGNCIYYSNDITHLPCAVNPKYFPANKPEKIEQQACPHFYAKESLEKQTIVQCKIRQLKNQKFSFELLIFYEELFLTQLVKTHSRWYSFQNYNSVKDVFNCVKDYIESSFNVYKLGLGYFIQTEEDDTFDDEYDFFYKNHVVIMSDWEKCIILDTLTNEELNLDDFNFPSYCTYDDMINFIKDKIDKIEKERDQLYVSGQLSLFLN